MTELKREANDLLHSIGRQEKYRIPTSENVKNKMEGKMKGKEREIRIEESRYYLGKDNVVYVTIIGEVDKKIANRYREAGAKMINMIEGTANVLVDINKAGKLSPEARGVFKELTENENARKIAIFGLHPVARVIASFFMGTTKKKDMRFFKTKEEALAWLKE